MICWFFCKLYKLYKHYKHYKHYKLYKSCTPWKSFSRLKKALACWFKTEAY